MGTKGVENNVLSSAIDAQLIRNDSGFFIGDSQIRNIDDKKSIDALVMRKRTGDIRPSMGKSVFYQHGASYMAHLFAVRYPTTKILITVRNPTDRLPSNFMFF